MNLLQSKSIQKQILNQRSDVMTFISSVPERGTCNPGSAGAHSGNAESEGNRIGQSQDNWQRMPYSTKGTQQSMPKKDTLSKQNLLLCLEPASNMMTMINSQATSAFIPQMKFKFPVLSKHLCQQLSLHKNLSQRFWTAVWNLTSQKSAGLKVSSSSSLNFQVCTRQKSHQGKGHNMTQVLLKNFSGRTPGVCLYPHP